MGGVPFKAGEGRCFYGSGGVFKASLHRTEYDANGQERRVTYAGFDEATLRVLKQAFQLLVSDETERRIGGLTVYKSTQNEGSQPSVLVTIGSDTYQLTLSSRGSGAARIVVWLPFERIDEQIVDRQEDLDIVADESDQS